VIKGNIRAATANENTAKFAIFGSTYFKIFTLSRIWADLQKMIFINSGQRRLPGRPWDNKIL